MRFKINRQHSALIVAICLLSVLLAFSFAFTPAEQRTTKRVENTSNFRAILNAVNTIHTGDLVLRTGADATSYIFTRFNQNDKTYSHCGIVIVENGYPFVYHSIGGEDNPDEKLRRDSAASWFSPAGNLGFGIVRFSMDSTELERLQASVYRYYQKETKFDMDFNLQTDDRLYCAEFAYKVYNFAMNDSSFIQPTHLLGKTYVAIDNLFLSGGATFVCRTEFK